MEQNVKSVDFSLFFKIGEKKYMERLVNEGMLYLNTVQWFRRCEKKMMGDPNEAADLIMQFPNINLKKQGEPDTKGHLTLTALSDVPKGNIYSLHAIKRSDLEPLVPEDNTPIKLPLNTKSFTGGDTIVFIWDMTDFIRRVEKALLLQGLECECHPVNYYDPMKAHDKLTPFDKDKYFKDQGEIRIFVPYKKDQPIELFVGSLLDITTMVPLSISEKLLFQYVNP